MPQLNQPRLKLVVIRSTQMERVAQWYRLLGIEFASETHGKGPTHFAVEIAGTVFEIYPVKDEAGVDRTTRLGFSVPDLRATITSMQNMGGEIVQAPQASPWGMRAVVRNPDGRTVERYALDPAL